MIDDSDLPIAHRKWVHGCTEHPIQRYVAYGKLSPSYKAFVTNLDSCRRRGSCIRKQQHLGFDNITTRLKSGWMQVDFHRQVQG